MISRNEPSAARPYDNLRCVVAGEHVADLIVEWTRLIGLKTVTELNEAHRTQCINYLRA